MWIEGWGRLPGRLVVVSGPSGSGKSTLLRGAMTRPGVSAQFSVSATTRKPRDGEVEGRDYHFLSSVEFERMQHSNKFLEWAEFNQNLYGTPSEPIFQAMSIGKTVVLEIEVKGALQVRNVAPTAYFVFIDVPEFLTLEERLRARGTEDEPSIHRRLVRARLERENAHWYDERIVNDDLERATAQLAQILRTDHYSGA